MASLKDIRIRIESTKNTQQITKAMKLVSAAKLRKAQHQIVNMRLYAHSLLKVIANISLSGRASHALLSPKADPKTLLLLVLSSDRGLCGGFNAQINKFTDNFIKANIEANGGKYEKIDFIFIGRRASDFFSKKKLNVLESLQRLDKDISYELAAGIAEKAMSYFVHGHYDEVRLIYNEFKSAISQAVVCETLLPVDLKRQTLLATEGISPGFATDLVFEPSPEVMIEQLLAKHFSIQVFRCMAESVAAEHGARMTAMENATNNAKEVLGKLTLTYNKLRQEKITTELIEIVSGAEAL